MQNLKRTPVLIALAVAVIGIGGYIAYQVKLDADIKAFDKILNEATAPTSSQPVIMMADYILISTGQSYDQVKSLLGSDGTELSRVELAGTPTTVVYQWMNPNGSNAIITFQDGKVVMKAQALLK